MHTYLCYFRLYVSHCRSAQVLGLFSMGGGLFLKFGQSTAMSFIAPMQNAVVKQGEAAASSLSSAPSLDDAVSGLTSTLDISAYVLIAFGVFMIAVGGVGCSGACCSVRALLITV